MSQPSQPSIVQFKHWDQALKQFFVDMSLTQTLRGFENDILVLNPDWEANQVPAAMAKFIQSLVSMNTSQPQERVADEEKKMITESDLEERKLSYVHPRNGENHRSQTSINKSIAQFIARNRARNDASNRAEFLRSLDEIRASTAAAHPDVDTSDWATCARTDMKTIDRDTQMKYDIAKNDDGPLKRTMKAASSGESYQAHAERSSFGTVVSGRADEDVTKAATAERFPAIDERISGIEKHVAVRYVPSPPKSLLDRLKFLEDYLIRLEKDYPPWAALHFSQPQRGWPPPPRSTPIIVPPHMRSATSGSTSAPAAAAATSSSSLVSATSHVPTSASRSRPEAGDGIEGMPSTGGSKMKYSTSSLKKAVLEKLEVVQAMNDISGGSNGGLNAWGT